VKYAHVTDPVRPSDDTIETITSPDLSLTPRAPDFFDESIATPNQIGLSFSPAHLLDREFRLEFFDRYLEWDRAQINGSDDRESPRSIVDLTVDPVPTSVTGMTITPVLRSLESV